MTDRVILLYCFLDEIVVCEEKRLKICLIFFLGVHSTEHTAGTYRITHNA